MGTGRSVSLSRSRFAICNQNEDGDNASEHKNAAGSWRDRQRKKAQAPPDINPFFCPAYGSASLGYAKGGQFFFARTLLRDFPRKLCSITFIDVYQRAQTIG